MLEAGQANVVKAVASEKDALWLYVHVRQTGIMEVAEPTQQRGDGVACAAWGVGLCLVVVQVLGEVSAGASPASRDEDAVRTCGEGVKWGRAGEAGLVVVGCGGAHSSTNDRESALRKAVW